jgi:hypothetical protein
MIQRFGLAIESPFRTISSGAVLPAPGGMHPVQHRISGPAIHPGDLANLQVGRETTRGIAALREPVAVIVAHWNPNNGAGPDRIQKPPRPAEGTSLSPMKSTANFKCRHCHEEHAADRRNRGRQRYCHKPECRRASKEFSQRQWRNRPENRNYFRGGDQCERVRQWRLAHPGYWRRKRPRAANALQDPSKPQVAGNTQVEAPVEVRTPPACQSPASALQEICLPQPALIVGLIALIT